MGPELPAGSWDTPPCVLSGRPVGHQRAPRTAGRVQADDRGPGWRPQRLRPGTGAQVTPTTAARGLAHRAQPGDRGSLRPLGKRQAPAKWGSQARPPQALGQALRGSRRWRLGSRGHTPAPRPAGRRVLPAWGMWSLRGCPGASEAMGTPRPCPLLSSVPVLPLHLWNPPLDTPPWPPPAQTGSSLSHNPPRLPITPQENPVASPPRCLALGRPPHPAPSRTGTGAGPGSPCPRHWS